MMSADALLQRRDLGRRKRRQRSYALLNSFGLRCAAGLGVRMERAEIRHALAYSHVLFDELRSDLAAVNK
jgi:hypothetical protein